MRPSIPDLSEPLLSPRRVRRVLIWVIVLAVLVALSVYLMHQPGWDPGDYT